MFKTLLILLGIMVIIGQPSMLELIAAAFTHVEYLVAGGVALLLKPWLEYHLG